MVWIADNYAIVAGDVSAMYAGRAYTLGRGQWETVSGGQALGSDGRARQRILRSADIRVTTAGGVIKRGIYIQGWVIGDPLHTEYVVPWFQGVQGASNMVGWSGEQPMMAGVQWRIHTLLGPALVATDLVLMAVSYE